MAGDGGRWLGALVAAATAVLPWLTLQRGDGAAGSGRDGTPLEREDVATVDQEEDDEALPPVVERAFEQIGLVSGRARERAEQFYAIYRLLKALGLSDADIAKLIAQRAGERVDQGLDHVRPTEARGVFDAIESTLLRAAEETDVRLNLRGDLVRRIREGAVAARAGREEALSGLERGLLQGREQLRRLLGGGGVDTPPTPHYGGSAPGTPGSCAEDEDGE